MGKTKLNDVKWKKICNNVYKENWRIKHLKLRNSHWKNPDRQKLQIFGGANLRGLELQGLNW